MRHIQVLGVVVDERDVFGGIIDIDQPVNTPEGQELIQAINAALNDPRPDYLPPNNPWIGSASISMGATDTYDMFEKMPFTGTIEAEAIIYVE